MPENEERETRERVEMGQLDFERKTRLKEDQPNSPLPSPEYPSRYTPHPSTHNPFVTPASSSLSFSPPNPPPFHFPNFLNTFSITSTPPLQFARSTTLECPSSALMNLIHFLFRSSSENGIVEDPLVLAFAKGPLPTEYPEEVAAVGVGALREELERLEAW